MILTITERDGKRKIIGTLKEGIFRKRVKGSKHLYMKLDAWGIDAEIFKDVLLGQTKQIRVLDTETDEIYFVETEKFDKKGSYLHFPPHRAQIFLPRRYWGKDKLKPKK